MTNRGDSVAANRRWLKFWPQDWQRDPALRSCGVAARGLWMDMLCIAHDGIPYGHVTINGKAANTRQLALITGTPEREVSKLLLELEEAGVFSKTAEGTIFSRRMERDHEAAKAGREAVEKRWQGDKAPNKQNGKNAISPPIRGADSLEAEAEAEAEAEKTPSLRSGGKAATKGSRLADDWTPGPEGAAYARKLGLDPKPIFTVFRNYWQTKPGKDGVKINWHQVWENWCIREARTTGSKPPTTSGNLFSREPNAFGSTVSNGL